MNQLTSNALFNLFRSLRHQLAWLSNCRPDLVAGVNILSQVTESKYNDRHVKGVNKIVKYLHETSSIGIPFPHLDVGMVKMVVFTGGSFTNTEDLSSQIGLIILIQDESGMENCLEYSSRKSRRVIRSVLGSELFAFADAFDVDVLICYELKWMLNK